jgi:MoaA/NifB/PqqE/SkfB family radical SAM enzyme
MPRRESSWKSHFGGTPRTGLDTAIINQKQEWVLANLPYYLEMAKRVRPLRAAPKIWNYLKYRSLPRKAVTSVRLYAPQIGALLLTVRCNLNCGYCNTARILREGRGNWRENEADLEKVKLIFNSPLFSRCLLVDLLGGEPLLVKEFDRIIAFLTERGHITNTFTNGLLLADRIADLKQAGISRINVSLYDENKSILERDLARINRVLPVHASLVLLRSMVENHPEKLLETVHFIREAGCLSLRFWMYRPVGENPLPQEIIPDTHPAYREFRRRMEEVLPGFCVWPAVVKKENVNRLCPQLWQRVGCDALGNMGICCGTDMTLPGPNGNLFEEDPDVVFNHPILVAMRKQLLDPDGEPPEICKNCNLLGEPGW